MSASLETLRAAVAAGPPFEASLLNALREDPRAGAQTLYHHCLRRQQAASREEERIRHMLRFEEMAHDNGFSIVAGVDEAGRGPLAGPIVAGAVVLAHPIHGLNDSKQLTEAQREHLFAELHRGGHHIGVSIVEAEAIDTMGIQTANYSAMAQAAHRIEPLPQFLLVDGFAIPGCAIPQQRIVKGDCQSLSIAAASIVAKVVRDRIMTELDRRFPEYGFARNKGYGTGEHLDALRKHGPCPVHRTSFAPISGIVQQEMFNEAAEGNAEWNRA